MRTGEHRHRIGIYRDTVTVAGNGNTEGVRELVIEMWAKVTPLTGSRALNAGQILNGKPFEVEVRNPAPLEITEKMLVVWNGMTITIHSVVEKDARGEVLLITGAVVK
ncbi:head-tail adaptor protein [Rufibacter roseus]|uniref:Head-tail adaptor protein n=1 Tax=Rufibacter roseus TaxID=1567108 RepID=A0ABW2DN26_9BACT|nr:head-tail adaptor protein [Rufibacter roseus]